MKAYSEDLRRKIVEAVERGTPKSEAARFFGVGISSVKRYVATACEGRSLAPKKRPGSKPRLNEGARKLLEADLEQRPEATLPQRREFLRRVVGVEVSDSTVSRMLKRLGWSRKKDCENWDHGSRDVTSYGSDPKQRGLRAFPPMRRPVRRASRHRRRSESGVTS